MRMEDVAIAFVLSLGCGGAQPEPATVATLPTPATTATHVAQPPPLPASRTDWPCEMPPVITEHQATTLVQMTRSGRPDLVQQAAEIRAKVCAGWAARSSAP